MKRIFRFDELKELYIPSYAKRVFTNGCFDILHAGHLEYLQEAKKLGDILIVGLNDDNSVRKIKGENRPINNEEARAKMLSQLRCVDYVVVFPHDTPIELIKKIKPDIHVKGGDYNAGDLPEADVLKQLDAEIKIMTLTSGYSTTDIISKIKTLYC